MDSIVRDFFVGSVEVLVKDLLEDMVFAPVCYYRSIS